MQTRGLPGATIVAPALGRLCASKSPRSPEGTGGGSKDMDNHEASLSLALARPGKHMLGTRLP